MLRSEPSPTPRESLLEASDLHRRYGKRSVLRGVTLSVARGEIVGIAGENGSGKSTLLRLLAGIERPDAGAIVRRGRLGYCPQETLVFDRLSVRENLDYFGTAYGLPDGPRRATLSDRLGVKLDDRTPVSDLSGGTRQKLNLAIALLHEPELLLLDEPYIAFDWESYLAFWDLARALRARGRALVLVSHLIYDRSQVDRLLQLREGRLACA
jgi:ABC-type multidrug transport system ATPase subunit